ncbi:PorT family protein [Chitinophaga pendula]|uniref:porin family protein n=1 Tax=Chitinophaga TaxID=79328 RepID=UPI000BAE8DC5|nr:MULTISPECIES: porin family protein [Chitinophaga]ASZ10473.1 hypothetical protein CK934_05525 [Chitinophaga sp. MD30]UCJ06556.1 PorT family protein [Chitinophaga pendula]
MTKKIILSCAALALSFGAMAQARVGVKGGVNFATISKDNAGNFSRSQGITRYHIGAIVDLPLSPILSLQPGVFYTSKGSKLEAGNKDNATITNPYSKNETNPQYIEVPINLVGKIPIGNGTTKLFAGIGPYFAFGVAGKNKSESSYKDATGATITASASKKIKWDDDNPFVNGDPNYGADKYKRFDFGGNLMVGAEFGNFLVSAQYGMGFAKINSGSVNSRNDNNKNRVFGVSVGYLFGRTPKNTKP